MINSYDFTTCSSTRSLDLVTLREGIPTCFTTNRTYQVDVNNRISVRRSACDSCSDVGTCRVDDILQTDIIDTSLIFGSTRSLRKNQFIIDISIQILVGFFNDCFVAIEISNSLTKLKDGLIVDTINIQNVTTILETEECDCFTSFKVTICHVSDINGVISWVDSEHSCSCTTGLTSDSYTTKCVLSKCTTNVFKV